MMTRNRRFGWRDRLRSVYLWHRYAGLTAALLAIWLAVTGIMLNHAHGLGLDRQYLASDFWLDVYGIQAPAPVDYRLGSHVASGAGKRLYWDGREVARDAGPLVGAVALDQVAALAAPEQVYLFTRDGERVDSLPAPAPIRGLGRSRDHRLLLFTAQGKFAATEDLLAFHATQAEGTEAQPSQVSATLNRAVRQSWRHRSITEERFLRDLHSGRLLAYAGPWLVDLGGILLCLLGMSGVWVWWQRRRARQAHRRG